MVQISGSTFYARLGVSRDASIQEIHSAYISAARMFHPDNNPSLDAGELFILVQEAYDVLSDGEKRARYDASLTVPEAQEKPVEVNLICSRSQVPHLDEEQLLYILLEVKAQPEIEASYQTPLNLCLALDRSTSMQGQRIEMVRSHAIQLLRQMKPSDLISIVTFSDRAEVLLPTTRVSDLGKIESRIGQITTGGGTEIFHGLELGLSQVRRNISPAYVNHLILITDGRTYGDEAACAVLAEEAGALGIGVSALGIGHEWNDAFLDQLATLSGGTSQYISSPNELQKFLDQKYNSLGKIFAEQVILDLEDNPLVELKYAFRLLPEAGQLAIHNPMRLGNLLHNQSLSIILEFLVKPGLGSKTDLKILTGSVRMDIPTNDIPTYRMSIDLSRAITLDTSPESTPIQLVQALSKLTLYRIQERAREEVSAGEIQKATRHLQYLATHLLSQGEKELAQTVLVEAENIHQNKKFSNEGDKRIKYGTRALFLPAGMENNSL